MYLNQGVTCLQPSAGGVWCISRTDFALEWNRPAVNPTHEFPHSAVATDSLSPGLRVPS